MKVPIYLREMKQKTKKLARRFREDDEKNPLFSLNSYFSLKIKIKFSFPFSRKERGKKTEPTEQMGEKEKRGLALWVDNMR